jgi:hypothetical protein
MLYNFVHKYFHIYFQKIRTPFKEHYYKYYKDIENLTIHLYYQI